MVVTSHSEEQREHHEKCQEILEKAVILYRRVRAITTKDHEFGDEATRGKLWNERILEKFGDGSGLILNLTSVVREEQDKFLRRMLESVKTDLGDDAFKRWQEYEAANRKEQDLTVKRRFFRDNEDLIFKLGEENSEDSSLEEQFNTMKEDWYRTTGPQTYFLQEEENSRLSSCSNKPRHQDKLADRQLRLFAINEEEETAEEIIENWAKSCFRTSFYRHILDAPDEKWNYNDSVLKFDDLLESRLHHGMEHSRAEEMVRLFEKLSWGPGRYVQSESILKEIYEKLDRHSILVFQGFGAIGKTALANKVIWDTRNADVFRDKYGFEAFPRYKYFTSKVSSGQGTLEGGKIVRTDETKNIGEALGNRSSAGPDRLRGSARQIWLGIVGLFEPTNERDTLEDLRRKSIELLEKNRVLVIIDNFEDFQNPLVHPGKGDKLSDAMEETVREEYILIVGWLQEIQDLGRSFNSRVIITKRGGTWNQAGGRNADIPGIPGHGTNIKPLEAEEASKLLATAIQSQIDGYEEIIEQARDRGQKTEMASYRNKLGEAVQSLQNPDIRAQITNHLRNEWEDGASPQLIIDGASTLVTYDGEGAKLLLTMLKDYSEGNARTEAYYRYSTSKSLGLLYNNEASLEFIKGILRIRDWVYRGFTLDQLEFRHKLLNRDVDETEMLLNRIRLSYWIKRRDEEDGKQWWYWKPQIAKSLRDQLGIEAYEKELAEEELGKQRRPDAKGNNDEHNASIRKKTKTILSDKQRRKIEAKKEWLRRWVKFLDENDDFSEPGVGEHWLNNPEEAVDGSQKSILNEIGAESGHGDTLVDFLREDGVGLDQYQYVIEVADCANLTMDRMDLASKANGVGLWAEFSRSEGGSRDYEGEKSLLADSVCGLQKIWYGALTELWKRAHNECLGGDNPCTERCGHHRLTCFALTRDYLQKFSTVVNNCSLEDYQEIKNIRIDTLFSLADWSSQVRRQDLKEGEEFCNYLEQIGKRMGAVGDYKEASIEITDNQVKYFEKWLALFLDNTDLLPDEDEWLGRLRGFSFWVSLRLSIHHSIMGKILPEDKGLWKRIEYQKAGQKIAYENYNVNPEVVKKYIGKAHRLELSPPISQENKGSDNRPWQTSFNQLCKQKGGKLVQVGDYIQATLDRENGEGGALIQRGDSFDGRIIELKCQKFSSLNVSFPLQCMVVVRDLSLRSGYTIIWADIVSDEDGNPIQGREIPEVVIEGAENFIRHLAQEISSKPGNLLSSVQCDGFWKKHYSSYWRGFSKSKSELEEMLGWINKQDSNHHLEGLAKFSQNFGEGPKIFRGARGTMGTDKMVVMGSELQLQPEYLLGHGTTADFIHKQNQAKEGPCLPRIPYLLSLIIVQIAGQKLRSKAHLTYKQLSQHITENWKDLFIGDAYISSLFEMNNISRTVAFRLSHFGPRTKGQFNRRNKFKDVIDWGTIPEDSVLLCEQLRRSYRDNIKHKLNWTDWQITELWEEILDSYFDEAAKYCRDFQAVSSSSRS